MLYREYTEIVFKLLMYYRYFESIGCLLIVECHCKINVIEGKRGRKFRHRDFENPFRIYKERKITQLIISLCIL